MAQIARDEQLIPDLIVSSDAVRASVTASAMADATGGQLLLDPALYHAGAAEVLAALRRVVEQNVATVMIVGHNPGVEDLIARLTGDRADFPTSALAQIALPIERWSDLNISTRGKLVGLWRPKELP